MNITDNRRDVEQKLTLEFREKRNEQRSVRSIRVGQYCATD